MWAKKFVEAFHIYFPIKLPDLYNNIGPEGRIFP